MSCKVCESNLLEIFRASIMGKYEVSYFQCGHCGFIQTEEPYWLEEAYSKPIAQTDVGLVWRNQKLGPLVEQVITTHFDKNSQFLDYAGGYGLFTRIMRDRGYDFYHHDPFCENIFAGPFEIKNLDDTDIKFELITAFELFEHVENPIKTVSEFFQNSDSVFFSTKLVDSNKTYKSVKDWWYFAPETGQHIGFYSKKSLKILANKFNCTLVSNNRSHHLLTKKNIENLFPDSGLLRKGIKLLKLLLGIDFEKTGSQLYIYPNSRNNSLLEKDYEYIKENSK